MLASYHHCFNLSIDCVAQGVRRLGAAAVDMCHVALGIAEAYWEYRLKPWDMAAGVLVTYMSLLFVELRFFPPIVNEINICSLSGSVG